MAVMHVKLNFPGKRYAVKQCECGEVWKYLFHALIFYSKHWREIWIQVQVWTKQLWNRTMVLKNQSKNKIQSARISQDITTSTTVVAPRGWNSAWLCSHDWLRFDGTKAWSEPCRKFPLIESKKSALNLINY